MERQILFKAKRLNTGEWVEGDLLHRITDTCIAVKDMDDIVYYHVDPSTVCQYTGLKDGEGKEIWEHDLVLTTIAPLTFAKAEIIWSDKNGMFCLESENKKVCTWLPIPQIDRGIIRLHSKFDKEGIV